MGYSTWNTIRGCSRQDIYPRDHRCTSTCTNRSNWRPHSQILHCCHNSGFAPLFSQYIHTQIFAEGVRDKMFNTEIVATLGCALCNKDYSVKRRVVWIFTAAMLHGELHCFHRIFILKYPQMMFETRYLPEIIAALQCALTGLTDDLTVDFFAVAIAQGLLHCFSQYIHTQISAEGVRDKIFNTETVAALRCSLCDEDYHVRRRVVELFTAAIAQGALHYFHRIFVLKYL